MSHSKPSEQARSVSLSSQQEALNRHTTSGQQKRNNDLAKPTQLNRWLGQGPADDPWTPYSMNTERSGATGPRSVLYPTEVNLDAAANRSQHQN